jgi:hypothetical protein
VLGLGLCVVLGWIGTGQLLVDGNSGLESREAEAGDLGAEAMGHLLVFKHGESFEVFEQRIGALPPQRRESAWRGVGYNLVCLFARNRSSDLASQLTTALLRVDESYRAAALVGAQQAVSVGLPQVAPLSESPRRDELEAAIAAAQAAATAAPPHPR